MDGILILQMLALSTLLGLLVGLQRERKETTFAGIRTFPLVTVLGTLAAVLARDYDHHWMLPAGFLGVLVLVVIGSIPKLIHDPPKGGITTGVAMLLMYMVGAFVVFGSWAVAAAITGGVAILLYLKPQMHGVVQKLGENDLQAIMRFVLITCIVLPILPNEYYDAAAVVRPFFAERSFPSLDVVNPFEVWLIVVLVVGMSLLGYIGFRFLGRRRGILLGGILGGTISSTATTVSYSRRSSVAEESSHVAALTIIIAGTVAYVRVFIEIAVAGRVLLPAVTGPLLLLLLLSTLTTVIFWTMRSPSDEPHLEQSNPSELRPALLFGMVYVVVLIAVAAGRSYLADNGLYLVAFISGMTNVDAITLSTARLVEGGRLNVALGRNVVIVGVLSNLLFKAMIVACLGHCTLRKQIAVLFAPQLIAGIAILLLW